MSLTKTERKELHDYVNQFFESHRKHIHIITNCDDYDFKLKNNTLEKIASINMYKMNDKVLCELCKLISKYSIEEALSVLE